MLKIKDVFNRKYLKKVPVVGLIAIVVGLIVISVFGTGNWQQKSFTYKKLPSNYLIPEKSKFIYNASALKISKQAYRLIKSLPANFVTNGSVDYTEYLQSAINQHDIVLFPDFPVMVNKNGLLLKAGSIVIFDKHSALVMQPNELGNNAVIKVYKIQNVTLYSPVVIGDRLNHLGNTGEWGMGISVRASRNVKIYNPTISNCWGDGIYIGDIENIPSENITIYNALLDFNRRNGISLVSANNVKIINAVCSNTFGTAPMSGIDIEPDTNQNIINNILVDNIKTYNNAFYGFLISLSNLPGPLQRKVNISIIDPTDEGSPVGFYFNDFKQRYNNGHPLSGSVKIINPKWISNIQPFKGGTNYSYSPFLELKNIFIQKRKTSKSSSIDKQAILSLKKQYINQPKISIMQ